MSAFAPVSDVRRCWTPELRTDCGHTALIYVDLGEGRNRLGGSVLTQVYGALGTEPADLVSPALLRGLTTALVQLRAQGKVLAYHDRSAGGLAVTLIEMAFAGHCGIDVTIGLRNENERKNKAAAIADWVLPSFDDERRFFGDDSLQACAQRYLAAGAREVVVKNAGDAMVVADAAHQQVIDVGPPQVPVDSTAAGDAFNAAYLGARFAGEPAAEAARAGHALASRVIGAHGALVALDA